MAEEAPEETPGGGPSFKDYLDQLVRARRREPGRVLGTIGKGILRGAAGLGPAPEAPGRDDTEMAMLMKQNEALAGLEEAAIGDPSELAGKRLEFLETLLAEARQRLNKKADVYSAGELKRAELLLDTMQSKVDDARETLVTLEGKADSDSDADGTSVDMGKVERTFHRIQAELQKGASDTGEVETIVSTISNGRLNPAEETIILQSLQNPEQFLDTTSRGGAYLKLQGLAEAHGDRKSVV